MTGQPRCYDHRERETMPRLCHTCQRIAVEQDIVTRTVDALLTAGHALNTNAEETEGPTRERKIILSRLMEVDDEFLTVHTPEDLARGEILPFAWVRFVYGNDGYDVISDYTTNLEKVLKPINDYADTLS
jgi:hypothetical protein